MAEAAGIFRVGGDQKRWNKLPWPKHTQHMERWSKAAFTLGRFWGNVSEHTAYLWKNYRLGCSFTLIRRKHAMKTTTFESGNKSVYFENGTTSHLSFSSCKQQKRFETVYFEKGTTSHLSFSSCKQQKRQPARSVIGTWFFTCRD